MGKILESIPKFLSWRASKLKGIYINMLSGSISSMAHSASLLRNAQISVIIHHIIGTAYMLKRRPVVPTSCSFSAAASQFIADCRTGCEAVAYMKLMCSRLHRPTAFHIDQQNHFFISGVFRPPALWNSINKLFRGMVFIMAHNDFYGLFRFDHPNCWSNLNHVYVKLESFSRTKIKRKWCAFSSQRIKSTTNPKLCLSDNAS